MRLRLGAAVATAITIGIGLITLAGLLAGDELPLAGAISDFFLQLVTITVALTVLIGIVNLLTVHIGRLAQRRSGALYSLVLIASFFLVVGTYIFDERETSMVLLETVQVALESALAGLLFFALVYGAYRLMHRRVSWGNALFVLVLLVVLVAALPVDGLGRVTEVRDWLMNVPVSAGARGILLGIALATLVAGMRVLIGQDRSYRE